MSKPGDLPTPTPPSPRTAATSIQSLGRGMLGRMEAKKKAQQQADKYTYYQMTRGRSGGRKSRRGGRKSLRGGRKSRRGGRKSRKGGRMRTRASLKRAQKSYRRRRKASQCRGKGPAVCRSKPGCKYASGKKRSFCRNKKSTRRARR